MFDQIEKCIFNFISSFRSIGIHVPLFIASCCSSAQIVIFRCDWFANYWHLVQHRANSSCVCSLSNETTFPISVRLSIIIHIFVERKEISKIASRGNLPLPIRCKRMLDDFDSVWWIVEMCLLFVFGLYK